MRLAALARAVFGVTPSFARIHLHGSFASTGIGHGTDLALIAGLLGMAPADERIPQAYELAKEAGLAVEFIDADLGETHPNTAEFELFGEGCDSMVVRGSSVGGGDVVLTNIDGFEVEANGELPLLIVEHVDRPGEIAAVTGIIAESGVNIAQMRVSREKRGARALMLIETDAEVSDETAATIAAEAAVTGLKRLPRV